MKKIVIHNHNDIFTVIPCVRNARARASFHHRIQWNAESRGSTVYPSAPPFRSTIIRLRNDREELTNRLGEMISEVHELHSNEEKMEGEKPEIVSTVEYGIDREICYFTFGCIERLWRIVYRYRLIGHCTWWFMGGVGSTIGIRYQSIILSPFRSWCIVRRTIHSFVYREWRPGRPPI